MKIIVNRRGLILDIADIRYDIQVSIFCQIQVLILYRVKFNVQIIIGKMILHVKINQKSEINFFTFKQGIILQKNRF